LAAGKLKVDWKKARQINVVLKINNNQNNVIKIADTHQKGLLASNWYSG
jgi:hypothetical protein